ncbi:FKBP-type peptidyl-prolyl cis-trans isomerase [Putridiphycobacter roseus]|uniref:Peptidyl-prolyl cis-trans isomerase n=1 Tax=Putridiphycobacter roseus TaxID=2219161 RepID=A0A2W1MXZ0_9FLAO|nr:FKBP-type peptidyl-prolyl cis-trans isomerase [Putridiphycobacter roseus]PZE16050.1 FKBP-type peptidyl-prolyl cis-trans isomerase [Putridiphycobacter roseus]
MSEVKNNASYGVGMSIGQSLKSQNLEEIDLTSFLDGIKDVFNDKAKMNPEEANEVIQTYINSINEAKFATNKVEGAAFLSANAQKENITELPSGLQYEVIKEGNGAKPSETSEVTVHYHGTLTDGTVFDSSIERGEPATFGVNQVIKGWTEALQLMTVGSKYRLYIPEHLAYGANPHPQGPIKPYMALVFDVELIDIKG